MQGYALCLLERYQAAEAAYHAGLQLQPTHEQLRGRLLELQALLQGEAGSPGGGGGGGDEAGAGIGMQGGEPGRR